MLELLDEKLVELPGETVKRQHMVILPNDKDPNFKTAEVETHRICH